MPLFIRFFSIFSLIVIPCFYGNGGVLTNQQINLLLENDDAQIFTLASAIKTVTFTLEQNTDNDKGKTVVEYDKSGLLTNYHYVSTIDNGRNTMVITLIRTEANKWREKLTLAGVNIGNSVYSLENNTIQIEPILTDDADTPRIIKQRNEVMNHDQGEAMYFGYATPIENEDFSQRYQFNQYNNLIEYHLSDIDTSEYGYTSLIKLQLFYDELQRLVKSTELNSTTFMSEPEEKIITESTYSNYDHQGNWQTKTSHSNTEDAIYKRVIEYWDE